MPNLNIVASFNRTNGQYPDTLLFDAAGNLLGTTPAGGTYVFGTAFEIVKTNGAYANTPTTLLDFDINSNQPGTSLIADAAGDLFGTTEGGGPNSIGTVFEITKSGSGYASAPTTLASFDGADGTNPSELIADAAGNLIGTTIYGGVNSNGTVFEIPYANGAYGGAPTPLIVFNGTDGSNPAGPLIADAAGDLFGTTYRGGTDGDGVVFEIAKTNGAYASTPTILVNFNGTDGESPSGLTSDAAGDLFGTTGGTSGDGTVFEIPFINGTYATTPITLVSFNGTDGEDPNALIVDAAGDLFGTTSEGGTNGGYGTVFEIRCIDGTYTNTPLTLESFNGSNGAYPDGNLIFDSAGNLFGTTGLGGAGGWGVVFELSNLNTSGHPTPIADFAGSGTSDILLSGSGGIIDWMMSGGTYSSYNSFGNDPDYTILGTGDFNGDGVSDVLLLDNNDGEMIDWLLQGGRYSNYNVAGNANISGYGKVGIGDFNGDGTSDILLENGAGNLVDWIMQGGAFSNQNLIGNTSGYGVIGTGDFNGDGTADVLLENASGSIIDWMMNNGAYASNNSIGNANSSGYGVVGTGDFNGDGTTDVLLENGGGEVIDWIMQKGAYAGWYDIGNAGSYGIIGTGDYNGDGTTDILLENGSGNLIDWTMKGGTFSGWDNIGNAPGYKVIS